MDLLEGVPVYTENPIYPRIITVEERAVKKAYDNFADFFFYINEYPLAEHQFRWAIASLTCKRTNIIAPRESGKTAFLAVLMAWWIGRRPFTNSIFVSVAAEQALERLADVQEIVESQKFKNVFPHVFIDTNRPITKTEFSVWSDRWRDEEEEITYEQWRMKIRRDKRLDPKSKTLVAMGINSAKAPGKRTTGILAIDDPHDEKNSATEDQRNKVDSVIRKVLMRTMTREAKAILICTRWAETDLSGRFKEIKNRFGDFIWNTIEIPAIDADGNSYWEDKFPMDVLMDIRDESGDVIFQLMYMNNPLGLSSGEITMDMLRQILPEDLDEIMSEIVVSCDLAKALTSKADYTVFSAVARDKPKKTARGMREIFGVYVLDIWRDRIEFLKSIDALIKFIQHVEENYGTVKKVLFEKQGFQSNWADLLKAQKPDIEIGMVPTPPGNKDARHMSIAARAQGSRLYVNTGMKHYNMMCSELIAYPRAPHDDIVDSLGMPLVHWGSFGNARTGLKKRVVKI